MDSRRKIYLLDKNTNQLKTTVGGPIQEVWMCIHLQTSYLKAPCKPSNS